VTQGGNPRAPDIDRPTLRTSLPDGEHARRGPRGRSATIPPRTDQFPNHPPSNRPLPRQHGPRSARTDRNAALARRRAATFRGVGRLGGGWFGAWSVGRGMLPSGPSRPRPLRGCAVRRLRPGKPSLRSPRALRETARRTPRAAPPRLGRPVLPVPAGTHCPLPLPALPPLPAARCPPPVPEGRSGCGAAGCSQRATDAASSGCGPGLRCGSGSGSGQRAAGSGQRERERERERQQERKQRSPPTSRPRYHARPEAPCPPS
jgi:hypothetical protein